MFIGAFSFPIAVAPGMIGVVRLATNCCIFSGLDDDDEELLLFPKLENAVIEPPINSAPNKIANIANLRTLVLFPRGFLFLCFNLLQYRKSQSVI